MTTTPKTDAERQRAYKERKKAEKKTQVNLWLSDRAVKKMDKDRGEEDRSSYVEKLIKRPGK